MSKTKGGRILEVIEGVHLGKQGFLYYSDQTPETIEAKKLIVRFPDEDKKTLISATFCKSIGFFD